MSINTITYANKSYINQNASVPDINKVNDSDMNEIKSVVNDNANLMGDVSTLTTTANNVVGAINEINSKTDVYSSTETKTNEVWIDGRPIYRKTFTMNIGTATTFSQAHGITISNMANIWIDMGNSFFINETVSQPMGHYASSEDNSRAYLTATTINCYFGSIYSTIAKTAYITIKYVKESD